MGGSKKRDLLKVKRDLLRVFSHAQIVRIPVKTPPLGMIHVKNEHKFQYLILIPEPPQNKTTRSPHTSQTSTQIHRSPTQTTRIPPGLCAYRGHKRFATTDGMKSNLDAESGGALVSVGREQEGAHVSTLSPIRLFQLPGN